jgi:hypothetical protein
VKCRLVEPSIHAPWHATIRNHVGALVGTDELGDLMLDLLTGSLAPATYNNHGTGMRRFTVFCNEEELRRNYRSRHASLYSMAQPGRNRRG